MDLQQLIKEIKQIQNRQDFDSYIKENNKVLWDCLYNSTIEDLIDCNFDSDFYPNFIQSPLFIEFDEKRNKTEGFNAFLILLASVAEKFAKQKSITFIADHLETYLPDSSLKFRLKVISQLHSIDNIQIDYISLFERILNLLEKAENAEEDSYTRQIVDLLTYYYEKAESKLLEKGFIIEFETFKQLFYNETNLGKYYFLGHSKIQALVFGQILHELEITDVAVGILYPSERMQQIFQSEIIEPIRNHLQTQISKSILMGYTNDIIRREVLNYGKADFNSAYKNLSSDDIVALYCYFNMRKHYFSSYAVFLKMFASLQIIFKNEQLTPIFIDLGCGPLTSGLALADLYHIQTGKKLKFSYIGIDIANSMLRKAQKFSEVPDLFHEDARFHFFKNWNDISDSLFDDLMNENNPILLNASYLFANIDKVVAEDLARFVNKLVERYKDVHIIFQNPNRTDRNIQYDNFKELISFKMVDSKVEKMFYKTQPNSFSEPTSEDVYYEILSLKS